MVSFPTEPMNRPSAGTATRLAAIAKHYKTKETLETVWHDQEMLSTTKLALYTLKDLKNFLITFLELLGGTRSYIHMKI